MSSYHRSSGTGKLLFGIILGFIGGVLLAPKSGKETLEVLKAKAEELKGQGANIYEAGSTKIMAQAGERTEQIKLKIEDARTRLNDQVANVTEKVKETAGDLSEKATQSFSNAKTTMTQATDDLKVKAAQVSDDLKVKAAQVSDDLKGKTAQVADDIKNKAEEMRSSVSDADIRHAADRIEKLKQDLKQKEN